MKPPRVGGSSEQAEGPGLGGRQAGAVPAGSTPSSVTAAAIASSSSIASPQRALQIARRIQFHQAALGAGRSKPGPKAYLWLKKNRLPVRVDIILSPAKVSGIRVERVYAWISLPDALDTGGFLPALDESLFFRPRERDAAAGSFSEPVLIGARRS